MSFLADKKREHESAAEAAMADKNYAKAFFHTAKAAEFGLSLAEQTGGPIAERHLGDALELLDLAARIKGKAQTQDKAGVRQMVKAAGEDEKPAAGMFQLAEKPAERLDDVAGLEDVKTELREKVLEPFQHPDVYERFKLTVGGGILMYGPPGNGKTFIAKAIAGELDAAFFAVNLAQIKDKYVGETEKNLQKLFDEARGHPRAVIFLDEVDQLLAERGNRKVGAVAQFLSLTDGIVKGNNCTMILAATNRPWMLDKAVLRPGRLGAHVYVGPPDAAARAAIVRYSLRGVPAPEDLPTARIAARTENFSGADVAELCDRAKRGAKNRQLRSGQDEQVTADDFEGAMAKARPSVSPEQLRQYEQWRDAAVPPAGSDDED